MKYLIALLPIACLLTATVNAQAAPEYDFEIIIFEDKSGRYSNSEQWQHEVEESAANAITDGRSADTERVNTSDPDKANVRKIKGIGLDKYARRLKSSKRYNVLVHKAWRQTGLSHEDAIDIPIDSRPAGAADAGAGNHVEGSIKIVLARYLHIYTDMMYRQPRTDSAPLWYDREAQLYKQYPIKTHRRMRSKELHYLDHPMVGILVMAMPVETKDTDGEES